MKADRARRRGDPLRQPGTRAPQTANGAAKAIRNQIPGSSSYERATFAGASRGEVRSAMTAPAAVGDADDKIDVC
jgi:hypothetical protein